MAFLKTFNKKSRDIILSIVRMAKKIGIHTLAEGVETEEQMRFLRAIGCERLQGSCLLWPADAAGEAARCIGEAAVSA